MFNRVGSLLGTVATRSRAPKALVALQLRQIAQDSLKSTCSDLPKEIFDSIKASTFKNGVLTIVCPQYVSAELQMRSGGLIRDINRRVGRRIVNRLRFKGG